MVPPWMVFSYSVVCRGQVASLSIVPSHCLAAYRQPLAVVPAHASYSTGPLMAVVQTAHEAQVVATWLANNMAD